MIKEVELGNVCHFENGDRGKNYPSQSAFVEIGIPFISAKDLENNLIKHDNLNYISEETYNKLGSGKLQPNDILFCLRGSLGKFAINKDGLKGGIASSLVLLRAKEDLQINYLKHYLNSPRMKRLITKSDNGSSQPNLSGANVKKFPIPLPPLDQQKKIAAILDAADAYRQKTKALIEKYDELTQSLFLDMFGDPVINPKRITKDKLLTHIELVNGRAYKRPELLNQGTPVLRIQNLNGGDRWYYSDLDLPQNKYCVDGDLLFAWSASFGPYIYSGEKAIFHYHIWNCQVRETINKSFAYYLLLQLKESIKSASHGASMLHITKGKMENWDIIVPPMELQNQFAERVKAIEVQKAQAQASLAQAEDLFNSLLQRAFKGELTS